MDSNTWKQIAADLSDGSVKELHSAIMACAKKDDSLPEGQKIYSVRGSSDWKNQADIFEFELTERKILFKPIKW